MRVGIRADQAIRVLAELAVHPSPLSAAGLAAATDVPRSSLTAVVRDLRQARLIETRKGVVGGVRLRVPPDRITVADVIRAIEGPLVTIGEDRPSDVVYNGSAKRLVEVWVAARAALRQVLESVTVADVASGTLPDSISMLVEQPDAWHDR